MGNIVFAWDARKSRTNLAKHGISFDEGRSVFFDEDARFLDDPDHSFEEERYLLLGYSAKARCLVVSHCYRENEGVVRLISVRQATATEEQMYWSFR